MTNDYNFVTADNRRMTGNSLFNRKRESSLDKNGTDSGGWSGLNFAPDQPIYIGILL